MKRKREEEAVVPESQIRSAIKELSLMTVNLKSGGADDVSNRRSVDHHVPLRPFLSLCNLVIQVLDKIGPTMTVMRQDIHRNIQRLENFYETNPSMYWDAVEILKEEVNEGIAKKGPTSSKAFVWLTRSLDFTLALLELLVKDMGRNIEEAVEESYNSTLKPWHGWISSAAVKIALKLVPDNRTLVNILRVKGEDDEVVKKEMQKLISLLLPVLDQNKKTLKIYGLDKLRST